MGRGAASLVIKVERHFSSFVDVGLLAAAQCLVFSQSGYSHTAQHWGAHMCAVSVNQSIGMFY